MAVNRVQLVRHETAAADLFTGREGEVTVVTDTDELRLHDNDTLGGNRILNKTQNDATYQAADADLTALAGLDATAGMLAKIAANSYARRTITGTANKITVTNGNGSGGNPTITIPDGVQLVSPSVSGTLTAATLSLSGGIAATDAVTVGGDALAKLTQVPDRAVPAGTNLIFYDAAVPALFTLNTAIHDRVLMGDNTAGGGTGGQWAITGLSSPAHNHAATGLTMGQPSTQGDAQDGSGTVFQFSGQNHTHTFGGNVADTVATITSAGSWRPNHATVVCGTKDAVSVT